MEDDGLPRNIRDEKMQFAECTLLALYKTETEI